MIPRQPEPPALPGMLPPPANPAARAARWTRRQCVRLRWEIAPLAATAAYGTAIEAYAASSPGWGEPTAFGITGAALTAACLPLVDRNPAAAYASGAGAALSFWSCWQLAAGPSMGGILIGTLLAVAGSVPYWRFVASRRDHHTDTAAQVEVAKFDAMKAVAKLQIPAQRTAPAIEQHISGRSELPTVEWPGARPGLSIADPIPLSDRTSINLVGGHVLIGGGTDAGKSNLVHIVACTVITRSNACLLGIDMKPGAVELGIYRKAGARIASSKRDALDLLHWVRDEGIRRGEAMGATIHDEGTLTRAHTATEDDPHLVLVIDELAELVDADPNAAKILKSHTRLLRAMGITVVAATQSPSRHVFGGDSDSRGQYGTRVCVATFEPTQTNIILGQGAHGAGWRADQLDGRGSFLIQSRQHRNPEPDRSYRMTDQALAGHVGNWASSTPAVHRDTEPDPFAAPAKPAFESTGSVTGDILAYLKDHSGTPIEVAQAIGKNKDSVRALMSKLARDGHLVTDGRGNYRAAKSGVALAGNVIEISRRRSC